MKGFEAALPQFEALGAQVVGISTDHHLALAAWQKDQGSKQLFLSDFRRQMLPAGARRLEGSRQRGRPCADPSSISRSPRTLRASRANRPPTATPPGKGV